MTSETVSKIAAEYGRILDEGYTPDVDDFLRHVPENLRAETRRQLQALVARRTEEERGVEGAAPANLTPIESASSPAPVAAAAPTVRAAPVPIRINLAKPEVVAKPAPREAKKAKPTGPVKLTPEEARAMFRQMERRPARAGR